MAPFKAHSKDPWPAVVLQEILPVAPQTTCCLQILCAQPEGWVPLLQNSLAGVGCCWRLLGEMGDEDLAFKV